MLQSQVNQQLINTASRASLFPFHTAPLLNIRDKATQLPIPSGGANWLRKKKGRDVPIQARRESNKIKAVQDINIGSVDTITKVRAVVTIQLVVAGIFSRGGLKRALDDYADLFGKTMLLELVSAELDPDTGKEKDTIKAYAKKLKRDKDDMKYVADFDVPDSFGEVAAILVENEHHTEMFLENIVLEGFPSGTVGLNMTCGSWVHSKFDNPLKRVFFTNKSYLPCETPDGVKSYRTKELETLRGNGQGERKHSDRIYDYDVYNDLGSPDTSDDLKRPILGGKEHPYPRRCRTGRPKTKKDPNYESRTGSVYVPRDESFEDVKNITFGAKTLASALKGVVPSIQMSVIDQENGFPYFTAIDQLFDEGVDVPALKGSLLNTAVPRLFKLIDDISDSILQFETPQMVDRDKFAWFRDEEFSRQTLAGINPHIIQLVKEWPLRSTLDPKIYGPQESLITKDIIETEMRGYMTLDKAIEEKKIFIIDYHDILLPYVNKVREIKGTTLYGSRTLFFLAPDSTLKVLAIELTRPPSEDHPLWRHVFTPGFDATTCWLWRLAKAHVLAHDSGIHQLVSHWLRTHCCTEPYIIASNRQLSQMHPIYRLLHPHFRYTMEINALARDKLINADGVIEGAFSPRKYSLELCSVAYDLTWRFDREALPADLIGRGLAVEDPCAPHGLKLAIEDFPYANDGLLLWDILKEWVSDYVNYYYTDASLVESDEELQAWWTEVRTKGHADKKDEPWWPVLKTNKDLVGIITTIIWVTSGHHAAVNFGQYDYSGYFPNRPTIARINMPCEDPTESQWKQFLNRPETTLLKTFPSQMQATMVMVVLDVLSTHSPDEEYLGEFPEPAWAEEPVINAAFERLNGRLRELEGIIDAKNNDPNLKNRSGAGVVPYEFLKPFSEPGVTSKGVPYSISI